LKSAPETRRARQRSDQRRKKREAGRATPAATAALKDPPAPATATGAPHYAAGKARATDLDAPDSSAPLTTIPATTNSADAAAAVEEAVRSSEQKFRRLLEVANILPWEADLETRRFTYVGPQAKALLGFEPSAWLDEGFWFDHMHPDDREWVSLTRAEAVDRKQSLEFEYRMIAADGRTVWLHEIMTIVSGRGQRPWLGGFMLDITHRRETEESLRESKYLIEQIASASPVILYVFDVQSRKIIYVNGSVAEILGYSKEAFASMDPCFFISLTHPAETTSYTQHLTRLARMKEDEVLHREFRLRDAHGNWVWLSTRETVFKRDAKGVKEVVGTASDITERRQAVDELRSSEALFRKLAETTKVIPFEINLRSGSFAYVGPQAEHLFGYPLSAWGRPGFWASLVDPAYVEAAHFVSPPSGDVEGDFESEFPVRRADGRYIWIKQIVKHSAEKDERGRARGFLFDITDAKEAEMERERSRQLLRELAARSQGVREEERINLARELHDEMGQSLTLLRLDIAWLNNRMTKLAPGNPAIDPLQAKLGSMEHVLQDTLSTVRRIISSLRPPILDELGLADAIQWQADEFTRRVAIRCEVVADATDPLPKEVATGVFRIFQEILTNVARHAHATRVEVKLNRTPEGILQLRVADNGRGFREQEKANGKSFGLLGMRERAWALGGTVKIDSSPGAGTTVFVRLPLVLEKAETG
jgi:PAS domain S-box-containing protein